MEISTAVKAREKNCSQYSPASAKKGWGWSSRKHLHSRLRGSSEELWIQVEIAESGDLVKMSARGVKVEAARGSYGGIK